MRVNLREVEKLVGSWQPPSQQMELTLVGQELQGRRGEVRLGPRKHGVRSASRAHPCPAVHRSWCKYDTWACSPPPLRATRLCRQRRPREAKAEQPSRRQGELLRWKVQTRRGARVERSSRRPAEAVPATPPLRIPAALQRRCRLPAPRRRSECRSRPCRRRARKGVERAASASPTTGLHCALTRARRAASRTSQRKSRRSHPRSRISRSRSSSSRRRRRRRRCPCTRRTRRSRRRRRRRRRLDALGPRRVLRRLVQTSRRDLCSRRRGPRAPRRRKRNHWRRTS